MEAGVRRIRGTGLGRRLVDALVGWAAASDATAVELWVTAGNTPAIALYASAGFRPTGQRQPLPSDADHDEIRLRRALR